MQETIKSRIDSLRKPKSQTNTYPNQIKVDKEYQNNKFRNGKGDKTANNKEMQRIIRIYYIESESIKLNTQINI